MSTSEATIYLVAGATRGIGLALVASIAAKDPSAIIYAGGRHLAAASGLTELAAKYPGRIEIVKYVAGDKEGNQALATEIAKRYGRVDVVIANAGIANYMGKVHETPIQKYEEHFAVNLIGPIVLFQEFRDLLKASASPRFVATGSGVGSLEFIPMVPLDVAPYGISKASLNWVVRKIHCENDWLVAFPLDPGPVDTDMLRGVGVEQKDVAIPKELEMSLQNPDVVAGVMVDVIRNSTREEHGGQFCNLEGGKIPW